MAQFALNYVSHRIPVKFFLFILANFFPDLPTRFNARAKYRSASAADKRHLFRSRSPPRLCINFDIQVESEWVFSLVRSYVILSPTFRFISRFSIVYSDVMYSRWEASVIINPEKDWEAFKILSAVVFCPFRR